MLESFIGSSGLIGFVVKDGEEKLYMNLSRGMVKPVNISIETYLKLNMKLLGLSQWRSLLLEKNEKVIKEIKTVFPEFDLSELPN